MLLGAHLQYKSGRYSQHRHSQFRMSPWPLPVSVLLKIPSEVSATGTENASETCSLED
jgi:hypothetical protein